MAGCSRNLALAHAVVRLRPLQRALRAAVALRDTSARQFQDAGARADAITRGHADAILDELDDLVDHRSISAGRVALTDDELAVEARIRDDARVAGARLPLDAMIDALRLSDLDAETLVLASATELAPELAPVFAFIHDDVNRRELSVELACALTAGSLRERVARRASLGPYGRLRRLGLVTAGTGAARDDIRIVPDAFEALLGAPIDLALAFRDPAELSLDMPAVVPADEDHVSRAGRALASGTLEVIGVWGRPRAAREVVAAIASHAGMPVRRYPVAGVDPIAAAATAAALGAVLWIELDAFAERLPADLVDACCVARAPIVLTALHAWRPPELVAARGLVEIPIVELDHASRRVLWQAHLPDVDDRQLDRVASDFRFDALEVRAASRMARATAALHTNGCAVTAGDRLREACNAVARKYGERNTTLVIPRRGPDDLVLAPELHTRVLDLVDYFRAIPRVMDDWGFARRVSGGGIKALFTGDSGTGKTLAAEVVAGELGLPLLKVDLARVVSKWIGETEKNLDVAFGEARDSHAVLFFDEAEALFGARGDVRHGTDRYANLEVSYLLQRLEDHDGMVILATNLRDKIDPAFMRRFHSVIGFPRPTDKERRRMWQRVFTAATPLAGELDISVLARLDLTGAGIVGAAQTAAFLAAREDVPVSMAHVVRGLVRQFQREARVLTAHDLGAYAGHMAS